MTHVSKSYSLSRPFWSASAHVILPMRPLGLEGIPFPKLSQIRQNSPPVAVVGAGDGGAGVGDIVMSWGQPQRPLFVACSCKTRHCWVSNDNINAAVWAAWHVTIMLSGGSNWKIGANGFPIVTSPKAAGPQMLHRTLFSVGGAVGGAVGDRVGGVVGAAVGATVGVAVGSGVGRTVGDALGNAVGAGVGSGVGNGVGGVVG
mmetsp:Transcript_44878/g.108899  ORF Transcript_44878/g.108899 Transcript_44878/m.108899 type:complete len:202 (-) Transcript_44878:2286-2891(-)